MTSRTAVLRQFVNPRLAQRIEAALESLAVEHAPTQTAICDGCPIRHFEHLQGFALVPIDSEARDLLSEVTTELLTGCIRH